VYGPLLVGMRKPVYLMIPGNEVADIVNMAALAVRDANDQESETRALDVFDVAAMTTV
jgi:malate dehydrogenase (oxaloacetate-decarboxylating)(NADP+)